MHLREKLSPRECLYPSFPLYATKTMAKQRSESDAKVRKAYAKDPKVGEVVSIVDRTKKTAGQALYCTRSMLQGKAPFVGALKGISQCITLPIDMPMWGC